MGSFVLIDLKYNNVEFVDNVHALLKCLIAASADI